MTVNQVWVSQTIAKPSTCKQRLTHVVSCERSRAERVRSTQPCPVSEDPFPAYQLKPLLKFSHSSRTITVLALSMDRNTSERSDGVFAVRGPNKRCSWVGRASLDFELGNVAWIPFPLYTGLTRDCLSVFAQLRILKKFTFLSYLYLSSLAREVPCESFDLCRIFLRSLNPDTFID